MSCTKLGPRNEVVLKAQMGETEDDQTLKFENVYYDSASSNIREENMQVLLDCLNSIKGKMIEKSRCQLLWFKQ